MKTLIENLLELQTLEFNETGGGGEQKKAAELRAAVPTQIIAHYDRLRARGKKGVAVIRHQVCSACHVRVPQNTVLILMRNEDIQVCENCGRYLCLAEPEQPAVIPEKKIKRPRKSKAPLQTA